MSPATADFLQGIQSRLQYLQRASVSSGLDLALPGEGDEAVDRTIVFEHTMASREIAFRMRKIARDIEMTTLSRNERELLSSLFGLLDPS